MSASRPSTGDRGLARCFGNGDARAAGKVICSQRILRAQEFFELSLRNEFSATRTRARAKIENVISRPNRFLIVLDHNDGIAEIAQTAQRCQQARIVALMQADARFIENIENAREPGADLRRQPNALRFATGKRAAFAIQRQITEPDFDEKLQARFESRAQRRVTMARCCVVSSSVAMYSARLLQSSVR